MIKHLLIGCGGTGAWLAQALAKSLDEESLVVYCDGDRVEKRNLDRQLFTTKHIGRHKAVCLEKSVGGTARHVATSLTEYFSEETFAADVRFDWIWVAADNHSARLAAIEYADNADNSVSVIVCGNDLIEAEAYIYRKEWRGLEAKDPREFYPEILEPDPHNPLAPACTGDAIEAAPQLAIANIMAASHGLWLYYFWSERAPILDITLAHTFPTHVSSNAARFTIRPERSV